MRASFWIVLIAALGGAPARAGTDLYELIPLNPSLPGFHAPSYTGISSDGRLVGEATHQNQQYQFAVQWQAGAVSSIGLLGGKNSATGVAINNAGDAIGDFSIDGSEVVQWIYRNGALLDLATWLGSDIEVIDLGDGGHLLGSAMIGFDDVAFIWTGAGSATTPILPGSAFMPRAVNANGVAGGSAMIGVERLGVLWQGGAIIATIPAVGGIAAPNALRSTVLDVNDAGDAVGYVQVGGAPPWGEVFEAFVYSGGMLTRIGPPDPAYGHSEALFINNAGEVLVKAIKGSIATGIVTDYFVWKGGVLKLLNDLSPAPSTSVYLVEGIDDGGTILVQASTATTQGSFLLKPVPCSGTIASTGPGCPGSGGVTPFLSIEGCPTSGCSVTLSIGQALGGSSALVFLGQSAGGVPLGFGCQLNVAPLLPLILGPLPLSGTGAGAGSFTLETTVPPVSASISIGLQAFVLDNGVPGGFANTNGVLLAFP